MGWIGNAGQVRHTLMVFGVDKDANGNTLWWGNPPASFMGEKGDNAEWVIDDTACVAINGQKVPVVSLLGQTSYGMQVTVI